ncbi:hypothetical protein ZWY2020_050475 [Hordeum vulgare]|nr:hypothetical protein ZWY2020_050475 [Hordeum vulgare]
MMGGRGALDWRPATAAERERRPRGRTGAGGADDEGSSHTPGGRVEVAPCRAAGVPDKDGDRDGVAIHPSIHMLSTVGARVGPGDSSAPGSSTLGERFVLSGPGACLLLERLPLDGGRPAGPVTDREAVSDRPTD